VSGLACAARKRRVLGLRSLLASGELGRERQRVQWRAAELGGGAENQVKRPVMVLSAKADYVLRETQFAQRSAQTQPLLRGSISAMRTLVLPQRLQVQTVFCSSLSQLLCHWCLRTRQIGPGLMGAHHPWETTIQGRTSGGKQARAPGAAFHCRTTAMEVPCQSSAKASPMPAADWPSP
jgi:hypothetical protein